MMKFGILGTGMVGRTIGARLADLAHEVMMGTRDTAETMGRSEHDRMGNAPFSAWLQDHSGVRLGTFAQAAAHGDIVVNATSGAGALKALELAGAANLGRKILIDVSNPLDSSRGMPPTLSVVNTDSLAEQIQRAFPQARVVKTLNTVNAHLMTDPARLGQADHTIFLSGNDAESKEEVTTLLKSFGWKDILDLGDITTARGPEMYLPLWLRLWGALQSPMLNVKIVR